MEIGLKELKSRVSIVVTSAFCLIAAGATSSAFGQDVFRSVDSDSAAVVAANQVTDIMQACVDRQIGKLPVAVMKAQYVDSTTPGIHEQMTGRASWMVSFQDFEALLESLAGVETGTTPPKTCDVWIDSLSGQLLLVDIRPTDTAIELRVPTEAELAEDIGFRGAEYLGLPHQMPRIGMLSALVRCKAFPLCSKQTVIQYVLVAIRGETAPFWIVHMRGCGYSKTPYGLSEDTPLIVNSLLLMNALSGDSPPLATIKHPVPSKGSGHSHP